MSVLSEMNFRYLAWHCFIDNTTSHPLSLRFPSPQNASGSPWRGFVNDIYSKDYALVNRVADRQRYEAIFAARHSVQPQERHYAQYRAVCLQPTSRYSEPNNWKACVLAPIQEAVTGTAPLDEAIQTAVTNWNRERVE